MGGAERHRFHVATPVLPQSSNDPSDALPSGRPPATTASARARRPRRGTRSLRALPPATPSSRFLAPHAHGQPRASPAAPRRFRPTSAVAASAARYPVARAAPHRDERKCASPDHGRVPDAWAIHLDCRSWARSRHRVSRRHRAPSQAQCRGPCIAPSMHAQHGCGLRPAGNRSGRDSPSDGETAVRQADMAGVAARVPGGTS